MQYSVFAQKDENGDITGVGFPRPVEECKKCHTGGATSAELHGKAVRRRLRLLPRRRQSVVAGHRRRTAGDESLPEPGIRRRRLRLLPRRRLGQGVRHLGRRRARGAGTVDAAGGVELRASSASPTTPPVRPRRSPSSSPTTPARRCMDLSGLNRVGFTIAGPTTDYAQVFTPTAVGGGASGTLTGPDADGVFQYTVPASAMIPANAMGTGRSAPRRAARSRCRPFRRSRTRRSTKRR